MVGACALTACAEMSVCGTGVEKKENRNREKEIPGRERKSERQGE